MKPRRYFGISAALIGIAAGRILACDATLSASRSAPAYARRRLALAGTP